MSIDRAQRLFLLAMGVGLVPVALSYGAVPERSLPFLFGIAEPDLSTQHIFRAVMGLYLGMISFWLAGALSRALRRPALWTVFVFVTGIALGRALSVALDGWPRPLLIAYLLAELVLAAISLSLLFRGSGAAGERAP
ncbi:MAG: DUF4345 domain-containing protein [Pseudomonadota bacterium]